MCVIHKYPACNRAYYFILVSSIKYVIDRIVSMSKVFILPVPNRSAEILLPIISIHREYIISDSIIHRNKWCAYNALRNEDSYIHQTVTHIDNFVDPETGVHTKNIEKLWRQMRANIPRYGTRNYTRHFTNYLAEFLFKRILMNASMLSLR